MRFIDHTELMNELWKLSAEETATSVLKRDISAREVIEQSLDRLNAINPKINAVVQQMPEKALAAADRIDAAIGRGKTPGPLTGVPVTVKINVDQKGQATTNGLVTLQNNIAKHDSPVVSNLIKAGAIVIGRTNTPAFSLRWFTRNQLHGHTCNPHNPNLTPGGSSGGAAAATAAGIGAIGHGTDIAGSIRYPAYACGLHGLRPTIGRIPAVNRSLRDRHIGPQITVTSGPMGRTVRDIELAFDAMSQPSNLDPWWVPVPKNLGAFKKMAAVCPYPDGLDTVPEVVEAVYLAAKHLENRGWQIVQTDCPPLREPMHLQFQLWLSEFHLDQGAAIRAENDPDANFVYEQLISLHKPPTLGRFMEILQKRVALIRTWQQFLARYPVLICPVSAELPFPDQLDVQSPQAFQRVIAAQMTQIGLPFLGIPAMTVTTGKTDSTPLGVQLVADRYREDVLFAAGKAIEAQSDKIEIVSDI